MLNFSTIPFIKHFSKKEIPSFPGICYECDFSIEKYSDSIVFPLLGEGLHPSVLNAVAKRKSEFLAGRFLAKHALFTFDVNKTSVGVGAHRAPIWPESYVGSISHSDTYAICVVASRNDIKYIGIDVENIIDNQIAKDIVGNIHTETEYALVGSYAEPEPYLLTLIFSAKESLFKALYPDVKYYFDFKVAQVIELCFQSGSFIIELVQELSPTLPVGYRVTGTFERKGKQVFTMIACAN